MHRHVLGLVTLDQILRLILGGMHGVSLELYFGGDLFLDRPSDSARFRIPLNVIANRQLACNRMPP